MLRPMMYQATRALHSSRLSNAQRLEGKVAIVTASTEGIGFSIARRLAEEGAKVMISSRKAEKVQKAVKELKSEGLQIEGTVCHVGKSEDRKHLLKKTEEIFGKLDILISNAAINPETTAVLDTAEQVWDKIFDINVKSTYMLMQEALPLLKQNKSASITIISSVAAYRPFPLLGVYSISKTALLGLCKITAIELAGDGIRVNCIAPGIIKTKFSKVLYESKEAYEIATDQIFMKRLGMPAEIAGVAAFLVSDDASYITGETIVASGGMHSRL